MVAIIAAIFGRLAVRPSDKLTVVGLGHLLELRGSGAYFRATRCRERGALRREHDCVSNDNEGKEALELCVQCYPQV